LNPLASPLRRRLRTVTRAAHLGRITIAVAINEPEVADVFVSESIAVVVLAVALFRWWIA
jgi:hypothetical protein